MIMSICIIRFYFNTNQKMGCVCWELALIQSLSVKPVTDVCWFSPYAKHGRQMSVLYGCTTIPRSWGWRNVKQQMPWYSFLRNQQIG
jgi:hypothetical protein